MSSTRYSPWERATRSQATAMAAALATQQMQQNQLAEFGGRVRHWERIPVVVCGQRGFGPDGSEKTLGGFKITKWSATDTSIPQEQCVPKKGIEPIRVPFKRATSPGPDPEGPSGKTTEKLPPRRSSRLSMTQLAEQDNMSAPLTPNTTAMEDVEAADPKTDATAPPEEVKAEEKEGEQGEQGEREKAPSTVQENPVPMDSDVVDASVEKQPVIEDAAPAEKEPLAAKDGEVTPGANEEANQH